MGQSLEWHVVTAARERSSVCDEQVACRTKRSKADDAGVDGIPCKDCRRRDKLCVVPPSRRKKRVSTSQVPAPIEDRLARMEALLQNAVTTNPPAPASISLNQAGTHSVEPCATVETTATPSDTVSETIASSREEFRMTDRLTRHGNATSSPWTSLPKDSYSNTSQGFALDHSNVFPDGLSHDLQPAEQPRDSTTDQENIASSDNEEGVIQLQSVNWEHHGPSSWVSICSPPGLRWVCGRMGTNEFIDSAKLLVHTWSSRLTFQHHQIPAQRQPEPDAATAWAYTSGMVVHFWLCSSLELEQPARG